MNNGMRIIAGAGQYAKGDNKFLADKFIANVSSYFKKSFPNGTSSGGLRNTIGADHITFDFVLANPKVSIHNDPMHISFLIQWGSGFGEQPLTLEQGAELEFNVSSSSISVNPPEGSHLAMGRVKTKLTNVKKGGSLEKFDKKMKAWVPKLRKLFEEHKDNIYQVDKIDPKYLK